MGLGNGQLHLHPRWPARPLGDEARATPTPTANSAPAAAAPFRARTTYANAGGIGQVNLPANSIRGGARGTIEAWIRPDGPGVVVGYNNAAATSWVPALYVGTDNLLRGTTWGFPTLTGPICDTLAQQIVDEVQSPCADSSRHLALAELRGCLCAV